MSIKIKITVVLLFALVLSPYVYAGSGAGGEIKFFNDSDKHVSITYSGVGCAGWFYGLTLVCESYTDIAPHRSILYKYNGGVTTTWVNVMAAKDDWSKYDQDSAPCGPQPNKKGCFADHHDVSTTAYEVSPYHFTG